MRAPQNTPVITPYQRRHRHAVRDLLFRSYRVHTHLDWQESDQWLDDGERYPARLVWQGSKLIGVLATSAPLNGTCWVRIASVADHSDAPTILKLLWDDLVPELRGLGVKTVALLIIRNWIADYAAGLGFAYRDEIITFRRARMEIPVDDPLPGLSIRLSQPDDLPTIQELDNRAFAAPWQMEKDELRQAHRISASCTVALLDGEMLGYQLSTLYFDGAHLARLAVVPEAQGKGVARSLLIDLLNRFSRRGVHSMTVNTQSTNLRSQRLYTGFGFERTGYDLQVWMVDL